MYLPQLLRRCDVAVGAFVVQLCIKVASCWLLGEMAWAIQAERVFDWWMVAETEVSPSRLSRESPNSGWISQHPIAPDGSDMKNLLRHVGERLGHIGEVSDLLQTICILPMLQYQTQVNQMRDAWYWQSLNTVLVQSDDDGVAKDAASKFRGGILIMELYPLSWSKRVSQRKKLSDIWILTFARFEILSYLIILSKGLIQYRTKAGQNTDNYLYIKYLREQNASLTVIMIDWQTIRWRYYSHRKIPRNKKVGKCWAKSRKCRETGIEGRNNLTWRYVCRVKAERSGLIIQHLCDQPTVKMLTVSGDRRQMTDYSWPAQG